MEKEKMQQKNKNNAVRRLLDKPLAMADSVKLALSAFSLDMPDRKHITLHGCNRIAYYSPSLITLALERNYINICGKSLFCTAFSKSAVGINGEIRCVFFSDRMPKGR